MEYNFLAINLIFLGQYMQLEMRKYFIISLKGTEIDANFLETIG